MSESKKPVDTAIRRLLIKHPIHSVLISVTPDGAVARAEPCSFHPWVALRREEAFAKLGHRVTRDQAFEVQQNAMAPIGYGRGKTIEEAVAELALALSNPSPESRP